MISFSKKIIVILIIILVFNALALAQTDQQKEIPEVLKLENCVIKNGKKITLKPKPISFSFSNNYNHRIILTIKKTKEHINNTKVNIKLVNHIDEIINVIKK